MKTRSEWQILRLKQINLQLATKIQHLEFSCSEKVRQVLPLRSPPAHADPTLVAPSSWSFQLKYGLREPGSVPSLGILFLLSLPRARPERDFPEQTECHRMQLLAVCSPGPGGNVAQKVLTLYVFAFT